jgi:hypothetical protein
VSCLGGNIGHDGQWTWKNYPAHGRRMGRGEDDPGLLIMWDYGNLALTVTISTKLTLVVVSLQRVWALTRSHSKVADGLIDPHSDCWWWRSCCCWQRLDCSRHHYALWKCPCCCLFSRLLWIIRSPPQLGVFFVLANRKVPATASRDGLVPPSPALRVPLFEKPRAGSSS